MYCVQDLFQKHGPQLGLKLIAGESGLNRQIKVPEVHRPGLSLSGYLKNYASQRILVFGNVEARYLRDLDKKLRLSRLQAILTSQTPAVILAGRYTPLKELVRVCSEVKIPLFQAQGSTMSLVSKMTLILNEEFSLTMTCHGTLVEAFGVGLLIQGDSSVGKSEAALGLIERGHRLISDDVVRIRLREGSSLQGSGPELTRHLLEIRGIGIINVAHLYGAVCVRDEKTIDLIIKLEEWDERRFYDRVGLDEKYCDILGIKVPFHVIPVKQGRDIVLLIETIVLNQRLKEMGYHSAREFNAKLLESISRKQSKRAKICEAHAQSES
ncbi:MAG: HPr(Ser) kinase/phosphatase [Candidatus Rhabdochlamydia sp.]|jgi:HPr kinase/phosphorylase|nr:HPr kinase/phosphorylase [Chlamydiota bacterium]